MQGYEFGGGYKSDAEVAADYEGLARLLADTRAAFDESHSKATAAGSSTARRRIITLAYYPDGRQEVHLATMKQHVDLMHMMTYDQGSGHHSSFEFAERSARLGMYSKTRLAFLNCYRHYLTPTPSICPPRLATRHFQAPRPAAHARTPVLRPQLGHGRVDDI